MNGQDFFRVVQDAFEPFLTVLGFSMDAPAISGRSYRASFTGARNSIWISYEPGENAFFVMVFSRYQGQLSDIDDRDKTPRISDLNSRYMHLINEDERAENEFFFRTVSVRDQEEKMLLKYAKELRLVLPRYLSA